MAGSVIASQLSPTPILSFGSQLVGGRRASKRGLGGMTRQKVCCAHLGGALHLNLKHEFVGSRAMACRSCIRTPMRAKHHDIAPVPLSIFWTTRRQCALKVWILAMIQAGRRPMVLSASEGARRFATWSRRYLIVVGIADALVGGTAAAVPASISDTLSWATGWRCSACSVSSSGQRRSRCAVDIDVTGSALASTSQVR